MTAPRLSPSADRPEATKEPQGLLRCTIYTRREDAAEAYAAGLAGSLRTVDASVAAGILAGYGIDGTTGYDIARQLAAYATTWMEIGELAAYRIDVREGEGDLVWTCLTPADGWTKVDDAADWTPENAWTVLGGGFASSAESAAALAAHAWAHRIDVLDAVQMPTVIIDRDATVDCYFAASAARKRGLAIESVDRAYGILRAAGVTVDWETLLACAAGIEWGASTRVVGEATE